MLCILLLALPFLKRRLPFRAGVESAERRKQDTGHCFYLKVRYDRLCIFRLPWLCRGHLFHLLIFGFQRCGPAGPSLHWGALPTRRCLLDVLTAIFLDGLRPGPASATSVKTGSPYIPRCCTPHTCRGLCTAALYGFAATAHYTLLGIRIAPRDIALTSTGLI